MFKKIKGHLIKIKTSGTYTDETAQYVLSLGDLIENGNEFYIEAYQRPYAWGKDQVKELLNDIDNVKGNSYHFLSTIYLGAHRGNGIGRPIIDGQQRITTLYLILEYYKKCFCNDASMPLFSIKLRIGNAYHNIFEDINEKNDPNILKIYKYQIKNNRRVIAEYFGDNVGKINNNFSKIILENICFLALELQDEKSETLFFRDLNSKGIHLDEIDKIKCEILNIFYKDNENIFLEHWSNINKCSNPKSLKKSSKLFISDLLKTLSGAEKEKKPKLEQFLRYREYDVKQFQTMFSKKVEQFECFELDEKLIFSVENEKKSLEWTEFQILNLFFKKIGFKDLLSKVVRNDYESYFDKTSKTPKKLLLLFLLFIFSYLMEAHMSFGDSAGRKIIQTFVNLNEEDRKRKLKELYQKFIDENTIDKINYFDKKTKKIAYVIYFLFLVGKNETIREAYSQITTSNHRKLKELDHLLPKVPNYTSYGGKSKVCKDFSPLYRDDINSGINKVFNLLPLSKNQNAAKGNKISNSVLQKNHDGEICGLNEKKIKEIWNDNKTEYPLAIGAAIKKITK